ncbi:MULTISPECIES: tetratricopeptide repeat protein [unclassified Parabacteroides]|uniref:tetratricopeptide repeat protein n=1 Tax=unclassified Parabacteroides TaxID=2649774 RepID=UPI002476EEA3|nr:MULTISPECIES: tetratricopeptide repeat protein [unclassified Parabacteroides]
MKRVLFTLALCVVASTSFAQKKTVNEAQSIAKGSNPNFEEARGLIKGALENAETKDDPKTWYVAGYVEDQQFSAERMKQVLGQQPNEPVMYKALMNILPYFVKSYELDQLPDAKGKVKPKYTKDIKGVLSANHVYYINAGAYYFDNRDYQTAYDCFEQYIEISNLPMFKGEKVAERDSNYMTVQFYAAVAATQLNNSDLAIAALERAKNMDYRGNDIYQYLAYEYEQKKDTVMLEQTLKEGLTKYPEENYFLLSLINNYIYSNRNAEAIEYLKTAIASDPNNAQLYDVMGRVYESGLKEMDNAEQYFKKALEIDPNFSDALSNLGRVYYNQGVNKLGEANMINDAKLYQEESEKAKEYFRQAMPYFQKVREVKPDDRDAMIALRSIYYNLNMNAEFEAIEAEMNNAE